MEKSILKLGLIIFFVNLFFISTVNLSAQEQTQQGADTESTQVQETSPSTEPSGAATQAPSETQAQILPSPAQEEKASAAAEKLEIQPEAVAKTMPAYKFTLKQLIEEARRNILRVEEDIRQQEILERNKTREAEIREHFEKGNALYQEGKLKEAKKEWEEVLRITGDPEMKNYIRQAEKIARKEDLSRQKKEAEEKARLAAEAKEKERLEVEQKHQSELARKQEEQRQQAELIRQKQEELARQQQEELARKEQERLQKEEQAKLEKQKQEEELGRQKQEAEEKARLAAEQKAKEEEEVQRRKQEELARKEQERLQKEEQAKLEKQRREEELAKKKKELEEKKMAELARKQEEQRQKEAKAIKKVGLPGATPLEAQINTLYAEGMNYYNNNEFDKAAEIFNQIKALKAAGGIEEKPEAKPVPTPKKVKVKEVTAPPAPPISQAELQAQINALYAEGMNYYNNNEFDKATEVFNKIKSLESAVGKKGKKR